MPLTLEAAELSIDLKESTVKCPNPTFCNGTIALSNGKKCDTCGMSVIRVKRYKPKNSSPITSITFRVINESDDQSKEMPRQ